MPDQTEIEAPPSIRGHLDNISALNAKLSFDAWQFLMYQGAQDALALSRRINNNAADFDKAVNAGIVLQGQTGSTANQQTVSPIRTASGDAIAAVPGVAAGGQAVNAEAITSVVADFAQAVQAAVSQAFAALVPALVTAAGGASTPSQTKPPTT